MIGRCLELCPTEFEDFVLDLLPLLLRLVVRGTSEQVVKGADSTVRLMLRTYCGIADRLTQTPRITTAMLSQMELAVLHGASGLRIATLQYFVVVVGFCLEGIARRTILTQHHDKGLKAQEEEAEAALAEALLSAASAIPPGSPPGSRRSQQTRRGNRGAGGSGAQQANEAARMREQQLQQRLIDVRSALKAEAERLPFGLQATALVEASLPALCDRVLWNALSDCASVSAADMGDFGLEPVAHFKLLSVLCGSHGKCSR
jgi:hypothetical protein